MERSDVIFREVLDNGSDVVFLDVLVVLVVLVVLFLLFVIRFELNDSGFQLLVPCANPLDRLKGQQLAFRVRLGDGIVHDAFRSIGTLHIFRDILAVLFFLFIVHCHLNGSGLVDNVEIERIAVGLLFQRHCLLGRRFFLVPRANHLDRLKGQQLAFLIPLDDDIYNDVFSSIDVLLGVLHFFRDILGVLFLLFAL